MGALERLEQILQKAMEGPLWAVFPRRLEPLELAGRLGRAMEDGALPMLDRTVVPNDFEVRLSPPDFARLEPLRASFQAEFAEYLRGLAGERRVQPAGPVQVRIVEDGSLARAEARVTAAFREEAPPPQAVADVDEAGHTRPLQVPVAGRPEGSAGGRTPWLEMVDQRGRTLRELALAKEFVIGRGFGNQLQLLDTRVSRRHAAIREETGRYYLEDLGSINGTQLNRRAVKKRQRLREGDRISLPGVILIFHEP